MNQLQTSTCYMEQKNLSILPNFDITIDILENNYHLPMEQLFQMAARLNKKRSFLFVSNVLGKHIPVHPTVSLSVGRLLAATYAEMKEEQLISTLVSSIKDRTIQPLPARFIKGKEPIIIGFAETATALGHSFFQSFEQATYIHTTREIYENKRPVITFEEEHSHATSHFVYADENFFKNNREIILVDDELTTGKTNLNIIRALHTRFPRKNYTVVSILDWRTKEHLKMYAQLEEELNITIRSISLLKGNFNVSTLPDLQGDTIFENKLQNLVMKELLGRPFFPEHYYEEIDGQLTFIKQGRFNINAEEQEELESHLFTIASELNKEKMDKVLCIGTGEFMYIPMQIASFLTKDVVFQSTTRSPIYPYSKDHYGAKSKISFPNIDDEKLQNYLYNIENSTYDTIVLFLEKKYTDIQLQPMMEQLRKIGAKKLIKVIF